MIRMSRRPVGGREALSSRRRDRVAIVLSVADTVVLASRHFSDSFREGQRC